MMTQEEYDANHAQWGSSEIPGCMPCDAGYHCENGISDYCPSGTYKALSGSDTFCVEIPAGYTAWEIQNYRNELDEIVSRYSNFGMTTIKECKSSELGTKYDYTQSTTANRLKTPTASDYKYGYSYSDGGHIQVLPNQTQHNIDFPEAIFPGYSNWVAAWVYNTEGCTLCPAGSYCQDGIRHDCAAGKTSFHATRWTTGDVVAKKTTIDPCFVCGPGSIAEAGAPECTVCQVYPKPN
jgi:hypothetical protein